MKNFIFGSTGYTGQALVAHARSLDLPTIAHIRPGSAQLDELAPHFESLGATIDTSPWELEPLTDALLTHRPDAVFCLIGTTRARMKALEAKGGDAAAASYEAVDFGLTDLLVRACLAAHHEDPTCAHPRFVYLSSMGTSGTSLNAYIKARYKAEQSVITSGLPYAIARPGIITGEDRQEDRPMEELAASINDAAIGLLNKLGAKKLYQRYRSTDAAELARALLRIAQRPERELIVEAEHLKD